MSTPEHSGEMGQPHIKPAKALSHPEAMAWLMIVDNYKITAPEPPTLMGPKSPEQVIDEHFPDI